MRILPLAPGFSASVVVVGLAVVVLPPPRVVVLLSVRRVVVPASPLSLPVVSPPVVSDGVVLSVDAAVLSAG